MRPEGVSLVYTIGILLLLLPMAFFIFRQPSALRNLFLWVVILAGLMWGYHLVIEVPQGGGQSAAPSLSAPGSPSPPPAEETQSPVRNL